MTGRVEALAFFVACLVGFGVAGQASKGFMAWCDRTGRDTVPWMLTEMALWIALCFGVTSGLYSLWSMIPEGA